MAVAARPLRLIICQPEPDGNLTTHIIIRLFLVPPVAYVHHAQIDRCVTEGAAA